MNVIDRLSSSLNRRDEVPNRILAGEIAESGDKQVIRELIDNLLNRNKRIQSDCIKVLYEIGEQKPELISEHADEFIALLGSKNNRLQWGAMTALNTIAMVRPDKIHSALNTIIAAADKGSVITRDQALNILIKLCAFEKYMENAFPLLMEQLQKSPIQQLPMYAERSMTAAAGKNRPIFAGILSSRLQETEKESQRKRIEKVLVKMSKTK